MSEPVLKRVKYHPETAEKPAYKGAEDYRFWCPGCNEVHGIRAKGSSPCWDFNGDLVKPTFSPSHLTGWHGENGEKFSEHRCHSFIKDGKIQFLNDCHHKLAGQTVDLPPLSAWRYGN